MYLRVTQRRRRDGSKVRYLALAENVWNAQTGRSEVRVVYNLGRFDREGWTQLQRLRTSIERVVSAPTGATASRGDTAAIEIEESRDLGLVHCAGALWAELGIGAALRHRLNVSGSADRLETAVFRLVLERLAEGSGERPTASARLGDRLWLPETEPFPPEEVDEVLRRLADKGADLERDISENLAETLSCPRDRVFCASLGGLRAGAPAALRQPPAERSGASTGGGMTRAFALTGAGLPMRSWGLPSERVAATGVAEVEAALGGWPARRRVLLGDAPARFEAWLQELDAGGHPYLVALPVRALKAAGHPVLKHPGRYRVIDPGLRAKEVRLKTDGTRRYIVGEGRPPGRHPADRAPHGGDHAGAPAGAEAPDSGRCGGAHTAAVGTAAGASGLTPKFVIATNDPAIALDRAVGVYRAARMMDARLCRRPAALSETDVATDPTALKRLTGEMKLEMLAFQLQRAAELRCGEEWAAIAAKLSRLQAVRYRASATTFVQRTAMTTELAELFTKLRISQPPKILHLDRLVASAGSP